MGSNSEVFAAHILEPSKPSTLLFEWYEVPFECIAAIPGGFVIYGIALVVVDLGGFSGDKLPRNQNVEPIPFHILQLTSLIAYRRFPILALMTTPWLVSRSKTSRYWKSSLRMSYSKGRSPGPSHSGRIFTGAITAMVKARQGQFLGRFDKTTSLE